MGFDAIGICKSKEYILYKCNMKCALKNISWNIITFKRIQRLFLSMVPAQIGILFNG
jgi:hypothetical protein